MRRIAIIGANGNMGLKRLRALYHAFGAEYCEKNIKLCDLNDSRVRKLAPTLPFTNNYHDILDDRSLDSIILSTPNGKQRDDMLLEAMSARKHLLVEKPLTLDERVIHKAFELAASRNLCLKTAYNLDFFPGVQVVRQNLHKVGIQKILYSVYGNGWLNPHNDVQGWIFDKNLGVGVEYFMGCHMVSLLWLFSGEQEIVTKDIRLTRSSPDHPADTATILIQFQSMLFNAIVSWVCWKNTFMVSLLGSDGMASINGLVKYTKYGQDGEKVSLVERQKGLPKETVTLFTYENVDRVSADLECLDLEMKAWIESIQKTDFNTQNEYRKNMFIHRCLALDDRQESHSP